MNSQFWSAEEFDRHAQRHYEAGDYDGALEILQRGAALHPAAVELRVSIGYTQLAREEYVWARQAFAGTLAIEPDHEDALAGLGESLLRLGERARAFRAFERVLDLGFARDLDLMLSIGRALFREGLWEQAARFFRLAADANERSAEAAADLGYALHRCGDVEGTQASLERALELEPRAHDARLLLGNILYERGQREAALAHLRLIPPDRLWDPLSAWRVVQLLQAYGGVSEDGQELDPYLERLDRLFAEPSPEERLFRELESGQGSGEQDIALSREQLELFGAQGASGPAAAPSPETGWSGIVEAMCRSSADPEQTVEEFMRSTARRLRDLTGIDIPHDDPEAFLKASARAGMLHIDRQPEPDGQGTVPEADAGLSW